jgi:hypothetical protein
MAPGQPPSYGPQQRLRLLLRQPQRRHRLLHAQARRGRTVQPRSVARRRAGAAHGYYTYILGDEATRYVHERKGQDKPFSCRCTSRRRTGPGKVPTTSMSRTASRTCSTTTAAA